MAKNKAVEKQELNHLEVVVEELTDELKKMSSLKPRLLPEEPGVRESVQPKKIKSKVGTSRPEDD